LVNPAIGAPCSSVTVTNTFTSLTFTLKVVSGACPEFALLGVVFAGADPPAAQGGLGTCALHSEALTVSKKMRLLIKKLGAP
jgi:hypothetical protein